MMARYAKGIAAAIGSTVAVGLGVLLGFGPDQVAEYSAEISALLVPIITTAAVVKGPANQ